MMTGVCFLFGYIRWSADLALTGPLSIEDEGTAVLRLWPDADLASNPQEDAISTSGCWIEMASVKDDSRSMPLHWGAQEQGGTSDSTPAAELDSMHHCIKMHGLPLADILDFLAAQSYYGS